ncbi:MAG: UDP-N-acetylglucosamine--LPS N-acetylglucosamine transferase [Boseongicola sp.]|nr:UDP-N-acetylglucosamine--LPS N-acetylglucosamine transferase [Boseongicola sp.]
MAKRSKRILAVASGGGHWVQLLRLRPVFEGFDVTYVSRDPSSSLDVPDARYFTIGDASRSQKLAFLGVILKASWILLRARPEIIITTGAAPGLVTLAVGKSLFRAKTIWIDSIANVEKLSGSAVFAARFADLRLTQWPDLAEDGVEHWGAVL